MTVDDTASAPADANEKLRALDMGTRFLVEQSLAVRSVGDTTKLINAGLGPKVTYNQVKRLRDAMRHSKKPLFIARRPRAPEPPIAAARNVGEERRAQQAAEHGSRALVCAQLRAGQHVLMLEDAWRIARLVGIEPAAVRPGVGSTARQIAA